MTRAPIILVPGFWLGAWAWDEVAEELRSRGRDVTALTLPGLASMDDDRASVTLADHVAAIQAAVEAARRPVVLASHSGAAVAAYAVSDRVPELIAAMVYVDTRPETGPIMADFADAELPLWSPEQLAENESLDGLSDEQLATFRDRAIPEPGAILRDSFPLANPRRLQVPSMMICTSWPAEAITSAIEDGQPWVRDLADLQKVTWVDLPTSHWPMWSRARELAGVIDLAG